MKRFLLEILIIAFIIILLFGISNVCAYSVDGVLDKVTKGDTASDSNYAGKSQIQDIINSQPSEQKEKNALYDFHVVMLIIIVIFILALVTILFLAVTNRIDLRML